MMLLGRGRQGLRSMLLLVGVVLLSACAGKAYKIQSESSDGTNMSDYRTFTWLKSPVVHMGNDVRNPLFDERLLTVTRKELEAAGYKYVASGNKAADSAQLVLVFTLGTKDKVRVTGSSYPTHYRGFYWDQTHVHQYTQGTLVMDVFDAKTQRPLWHGVAQGILKNRTPEEQQQLLQQLMADMVADFTGKPQEK